MKILKTNAGEFTNFEVLDHLRSRGAGKDPTRVIASVSPSEFKVYDYIEQTSACNQTREIVNECVRECKKYDLDETEILNVINMRPSKVFEILDEHDARIAGKIRQFIKSITQILPPHPSRIDCDDESNGAEEDEHETTQVQQAET